MAYKSDMIENVIKDVKVTDTNVIRVTQIQNNEGKIMGVDLRQWYCTSSDPELKPTKKGIRVGNENCEELLNAFLEACSEDIRSKFI